MSTLEQLYDPVKGTLHLNHTHIKLLSKLPELFEFIKQNHIQTFSIQGTEGCLYTGITFQLFHSLVQYLKVNKTLIELNVHIFRPVIKSGAYEYMLTDLLSVHPSLQRVYLSRYDQFGAYSHIMHK